MAQKIALRATGYWMPKDGSEDDEWEDSIGYSEDRGLFAVADGVANAYRSGEWAEALTTGFVESFPTGDTMSSLIRPWLLDRIDAWWSAHTQAANWWEEDADRDGAAATFLGLRLRAVGNRLIWEGISIGDCCLFRTAGGKVEPLIVPERFDHRPELVSNLRERTDELLRRNLRPQHGEAERGETFFLTSDALGAALKLYGASARWTSMATMGHHRFQQMITELRDHGAIENDDVTLLIVEIV